MKKIYLLLFLILLSCNKNQSTKTTRMLTVKPSLKGYVIGSKYYGEHGIMDTTVGGFIGNLVFYTEGDILNQITFHSSGDNYDSDATRFISLVEKEYSIKFNKWLIIDDGSVRLDKESSVIKNGIFYKVTVVKFKSSGRTGFSFWIWDKFDTDSKKVSPENDF